MFHKFILEFTFEQEYTHTIHSFKLSLTNIIHIIPFDFLNIIFIHAKLGSDVYPRADNQPLVTLHKKKSFKLFCCWGAAVLACRNEHENDDDVSSKSGSELITEKWISVTNFFQKMLILFSLFCKTIENISIYKKRKIIN